MITWLHTVSPLYFRFDFGDVGVSKRGRLNYSLRPSSIASVYNSVSTHPSLPDPPLYFIPSIKSQFLQVSPASQTTVSISILIMRFSALVAGLLSICAVVAAVPIEEVNTPEIDPAINYAGTAWYVGGGYTHMAIPGCFRTPKIISSVSVTRKHTCYIYP